VRKRRGKLFFILVATETRSTLRILKAKLLFLFIFTFFFFFSNLKIKVINGVQQTQKFLRFYNDVTGTFFISFIL
jgi:hypothetical protein